MKIKKIIPFLPLLVLCITLIYCAYIVSTTDIAFTTKYYIAMGLVLLCILTAFVKPSFLVYVTGFTILLGVFSIITFTPIIRQAHIQGKFIFIPLDFKLHYFSALLFLLWLFCLFIARKVKPVNY